MSDIFDEYFPVKLTDEQVLLEIIKEVDSRTEKLPADIDKVDYYCQKAELIGRLESSMGLVSDPAAAAYNAFKLAALISEVAGPRKLKEAIQRYDSMSLEVSEIVGELERSGLKPTAMRVWKELVKRCGQSGSCCIRLENDPVTDKQQIVWGGPGGAIQRMKFSGLQGRLVRKNRR